MLAWQLRSRGIFTAGDDAAYLLLGRALRGFTYREFQFVGNPIAARFPPGYPAMLALSGAAAGEHFGVIALVGILFSASGIAALFDVVRRRWSADTALVVAALVAINPALLAYVAEPASEMMYTALTMWSLWAADRIDATRLDPVKRPRLVAFGIGTAIAAALTRSAGVTLPLALIAHWTWRRRLRLAAVAALSSSVFVGGWLVWTTLAPRREVRLSYIDDAVRPAGNERSLARTIATRLATNVPGYATQISLSQLAVPVTRRTIVDNIGWVTILGALFLVGLVSAWRRWHAAAVYLLAYCALVAVWPYLLDRFLVPMLPLALAFIGIGAAHVGERLWRRGDVALAAVGTVLAVFALRADARLVAAADACDYARADCAHAVSLEFVDAARFAGTATPPNARFIAPKGATLYYHGRRQAVFWEEAVGQDSASFLPYLRANGVTHVLATPVYADYVTVLRLVEHSCTQFEVLRAFSPHTVLFAFRGDATPPSAAARSCAAVRRALASADAVTTALLDLPRSDGSLGTVPITTRGEFRLARVTMAGADGLAADPGIGKW